jgi:serine/threonine protein kinase
VYRALSLQPIESARDSPGGSRRQRQEVAIKILPFRDEDLDRIRAEITFLVKLRCPYVVSYLCSYHYDHELWVSLDMRVTMLSYIIEHLMPRSCPIQILMEYCPGGSLHDLYKATGRALSEGETRAVVAFATLGLHHLHSNRSIHRVSRNGYSSIYKYLVTMTTR